jgi:APA family basic amino acid/polyamine antiporter
MNKQTNKQLWKVLGMGFGIAITLGGTVGTGILRKPGPIMDLLQNPLLVSGLWLLVGIYALLGVSCVLELSLSLPKAGAWYVYAERAFGKYVGFLIGITSWLGTVTALGFGAYTCSEYLAIIFPFVGNYLSIFAISILALLWIFHQLGVVFAGKSQEWFSGVKALALIIFIVICATKGSGGVWVESPASPTGLPLWSGIMTALLSIFYAFDGWHTAAYFTEENTNPVKTMPQSMYIGVITVSLIYLLINVVIMYSLPLDILRHSKLAAADTITHLFGADYGRYITIFLMLSILGILNTQIMFAPRVIFSMSRDGLFFEKASHVNKMGTPNFATHLTIGLACLFLLAGKEINEKLSDIATFFFVTSYLSGFAALIQLRRKEPELERPYKVWAYPFVPAILLLISFGFLIGTVMQNPASGIYVLGLGAVSYLIYRGLLK